MDTSRRVGRPRAASREILEEAACELFLEQGYEATSVADITSRAGVSRSTFFNYVESKSDLLWARFDDAVAALREELSLARTSAPAGDREAEARAALVALAAGLTPENVALAYSQADVMGLGEDLRLAEVRRLAAVSEAIALHLLSGEGDRARDRLTAEVRATALAGALLAAVREWASAGAGRGPLRAVLDRALAALA